MTTVIKESELVLNSDGSIYHLNLLPEELAPIVITVGDPDRVAEVSKYFDVIEVNKANREYITHTGLYKGKRMSVISTGIGVNSIDIVINELDALVNVDFKSREVKEQQTQLQIIRLGTAGALQADIPLNSIVASEYVIGLGGLLNYYQRENNEKESLLLNKFTAHYPELKQICPPYIAQGSKALLTKFANMASFGLTFTCSGFYAPQGRQLRASPVLPDFIEKLQSFSCDSIKATNFEMETAAIYGLGRLTGHQVCSLSTILANRITNTFSKTAKESVDRMIQLALDRLA